MSSSCPQFWLDDPVVLWDGAMEFFPFTEHDKRCTASALNSFTRFGIYLSLVLTAVRMEPMWLIVGILFAGFAVGAWKFMSGRGAVREGFDGEQHFDTAAPILDPRDVINEYVPDIIGERMRTVPTAANPFMNVLLTDIGDNPYKPAAKNAGSQAVKAELDSYFQTMFADDPGDVFNHTSGQRNWVIMPSTTIPNDQESFANWLYRVPGQTCKEGNLDVCNFNTGAEGIPWREMRKLT
jgi:hypothetical protein